MSTTSWPGLHCLNYMRADGALPGRIPRWIPVLEGALEARVHPDTNRCVDWRRVYEELEKNQREYARWASESQRQVRNSLSFTLHVP